MIVLRAAAAGATPIKVDLVPGSTDRERAAALLRLYRHAGIRLATALRGRRWSLFGVRLRNTVIATLEIRKGGG